MFHLKVWWDVILMVKVPFHDTIKHWNNVNEEIPQNRVHELLVSGTF